MNKHINDWNAFIKATSNGNRAAFTELYEYFAPRIKTRMLRFGFSDTEAERLAQEALMNVWRNARKFTPGTDPRTWIFLAARDALARYRENKR